MTNEVISRSRRRMIEDRSITQSHHDRARLHRDRRTKPVHGRCTDHLDEQFETVSAGWRRSFSSSQRSVRPMRLKGPRDVDHIKVVECALFATANSLKSKAREKLLSPFSNIRAVTSKLCRGPTPTSGENHLAWKLRAALKSP